MSIFAIADPHLSFDENVDKPKKGLLSRLLKRK